MNTHFTIFVPSYNCVGWVKANIDSITRQGYDNYQLVYVDDCSTDGTYEEAERLLKQSKIDYKLHKNSFNKGKSYNLVHYINKLPEETVVVVVDGDDWLANEHVLSHLNKIYNEDIWMTCGSYAATDTNIVTSPRFNKHYWEGNIRKKSWEFSHLGTFRKKLFSKIKRKDFLDKSGNYFATTSDQAMMWPMAEMAGPEHFLAVPEALYIYNRSNPISDDRAHRRDQLETEASIRSRKPYQRLEAL
jgi:glycosyltransferase involved in cell wall biosynthesis